MSESEIIITAMYGLVSYNFFETMDGITLRLGKVAIRMWEKKDKAWFDQHLTELSLTLAQKYEFLIKALDRMGS